MRRRQAFAEQVKQSDALYKPQEFAGGPLTLAPVKMPAEQPYMVVRCPHCGIGFKDARSMKIHARHKHK